MRVGDGYKLSVYVPKALWENAMAQAGTTRPSIVIQRALKAFVGDFDERVKAGACWV